MQKAKSKNKHAFKCGSVTYQPPSPLKEHLFSIDDDLYNNDIDASIPSVDIHNGEKFRVVGANVIPPKPIYMSSSMKSSDKPTSQHRLNQFMANQ